MALVQPVRARDRRGAAPKPLLHAAAGLMQAGEGRVATRVLHEWRRGLLQTAEALELLHTYAAVAGLGVD